MFDVSTARLDHPGRRAQRGVFLISALVLVIVFGAMLTMWAQRESAATRVERARSIGDALAVLGNGLDDYIKNNHKEIVANTSVRSDGKPVVDIPKARDISVRHLIAYMRLRGVGDRPPHMPKGEYQIAITVFPPTSAGTLGGARRVTALLYIDAPVQHRGHTDLLMAKIAAKQVGRHGGVTEPANPAVVTFNDGANNVLQPVTNPLTKKDPSGKFIAGILVRRAGDVLSSVNEDYLPRNGSLPMTGALDMDKQDIKNVGKFESNGLMWLRGGDNSRDGAKFGLWVGDWRGDTPLGTPRGVMASGSITSLDTLHGLKASIGKGETKTEITGEHVQTPYIWARNAAGDEPEGMPLPKNRAGDIYASEAIRAGGNIHTDGHLRIGKGLLVGASNDVKWGDESDLWVTNDGHFGHKVFLRPYTSKVKVGDSCDGQEPHFVGIQDQILACQHGKYGEVGGRGGACSKKKIVVTEEGDGSIKARVTDLGLCELDTTFDGSMSRFDIESKLFIWRQFENRDRHELGRFYSCRIEHGPDEDSDPGRRSVKYKLVGPSSDYTWAWEMKYSGFPKRMKGMVVQCLLPVVL